MPDLSELSYEANWSVTVNGRVDLKWGGDRLVWFDGIQVDLYKRDPASVELKGRRILAGDFTAAVEFNPIYWGPLAGIRLGITSRFRTRDMVVIERQSIPDNDERFYSNCFVNRRWDPDPVIRPAANIRKFRIARKNGVVSTSVYSGRWYPVGKFDHPLYYDDVFLVLGVYNHSRKKPPIPRTRVGLANLKASW